MSWLIDILLFIFFFFFNDTATTEIYTLSLHDALPICGADELEVVGGRRDRRVGTGREGGLRPDLGLDLGRLDRKSTRLNSSHANISYAVFCLKKKKKTRQTYTNKIRPRKHQYLTTDIV